MEYPMLSDEDCELSQPLIPRLVLVDRQSRMLFIVGRVHIPCHQRAANLALAADSVTGRARAK